MMENTSEYKIGGTAYIVVTTFNVDGESLAELIARLIEKSIWLYKNVWTNSGINGFRNIRYYVDDGYSGTNFNRPDFVRMIDDVKAGKVGVVITKDLSQLGRDYLMTRQYIEMILPDYNVRYIDVNDGVDTSRSDKRF